MGRLTFPGYLKRYVRSLAGINTNSIFRLAKEAGANYRLREPLFLYALSVDKVDILLRGVKDNLLRDEYAVLANKYSWDEMLSALESSDRLLGSNYHKVYRSFISKRDMPQTNCDTKVLMHKKVKSLQDSKGISNYRLYTDLKLNPSNTNYFLKHGDVNKVSLDVARSMIAYLEAF